MERVIANEANVRGLPVAEVRQSYVAGVSMKIRVKAGDIAAMASFLASPADARISGQDVVNLPPEARPVNTVFQHYALFPHVTIRRNIGFGLEMLGADKATMAKTTNEMLELVHMTEFADRKPDQLSSGQKQRVALTRKKPWR